MKYEFQKVDSTVKPKRVDTESSTFGVYYRKNIEEVQKEEQTIYEYDEIYLSNKFRFSISDEDTYIAKIEEIMEKEEAEEKERISNLTMTKREFALCLQKIGVTYTQLKELIATNEQAQLEWDLCVVLERKNSLIDVMASSLGITSEMLDKIFQYANKEIDNLG